ncbi:MAG: hypothetical protein IJ415_01475 [Clostridia bacterium]|nr:hypothetical protein [Clostridia bacterium]
MGRGRSSSGGGGGSRGSSNFGGGRGSSRSSFGGGRVHRSHTTVIVGGGHGHYHSSGSPWVGIIVGAIFCIVGAFIVFGGFGQLFSSFNYSTVKAECVKNEKSGVWYYTTYDYTVDGKDYTNRSMEGWEFPEDIGKVVTIYYLKSDPNVIYEENPESKSEAGIMIFAGLICAGMGSIPLFVCIKEIKRNKSTPSTSSDSEIPEYQQPKEEQTNKCPYCGARYKKSSDSCPKCGASRID